MLSWHLLCAKLLWAAEKVERGRGTAGVGRKRRGLQSEHGARKAVMGARASRPVRPFPSAWSKAGEQRHLSGMLWEE